MVPTPPTDLAHNEPESNGQAAQPTPTPTVSDAQGYIGEFSVMSNKCPLPSEASTVVGSFSRTFEAQILAATGVDQLPSQPMMDALNAAYFQYLYHRIPVVDRQDIDSQSPSLLLQQSLCLAGSILRHSKSTKTLVESEKFYTRGKTLFYINAEQDPLTILKSVCLLGLWNVVPPALITIDCGWNWLGLAIRLALQMGLHRESTYAQRSSPGCTRRIAWYLFTHDKLHATCFGRPQMLRLDDFDLNPPSIADFDESDRGQARFFILYCDLMTKLAKVLRLQQQRDSTRSPEEALAILMELKTWVQNIPSFLSIFDDQGRKIYQRELHELLTWYFACIITFFSIHGRFFQPSDASRISLVASSCMIRLYQEIGLQGRHQLSPVNQQLVHDGSVTTAVEQPEQRELQRQFWR